MVSIWESITRGLLSVILGIFAFVLTGSIFNFFFVTIVIAVLWDYSEKFNEVHRRLAELEAKLAREPPAPS